jgi:uncharacterized phage protein (TIGR01671 family)
MREIIFRAWDKNGKEMSQAKDLYDFLVYSDNWFGARIYFKNSGYVPFIDCLIMQYTGLKDKNGKGKEIYEADIFNNTNKTAIGIVSWYKDQWIVKFPNYQYSLFQFLENDETREKIGNCFENPDLLK